MRIPLPAVVASVVGYLLGTVPTAELASRAAGGPDLRRTGSGNPGAANAAAVLGPRFGLAVLAVDVAKGASAGLIGSTLAGPTGAHLASSAAVIGHCHPVSRGFRGGKGVATSVGQVLATFPVYFPIDAAVALATAVSPRWKERSFTATATASAAWVGAALLWWRRGWSTGWGPPATAALPLAAMLSSAVIAGRFLATRDARPVVDAPTTSSPTSSLPGPEQR